MFALPYSLCLLLVTVLCLFVSLDYVCLSLTGLCLYFINFVTEIFIVIIQMACCKVNNPPVGAKGSLGIQELNK